MFVVICCFCVRLFLTVLPKKITKTKKQLLTNWKAQVRERKAARCVSTNSKEATTTKQKHAATKMKATWSFGKIYVTMGCRKKEAQVVTPKQKQVLENNKKVAWVLKVDVVYHSTCEITYSGFILGEFNFVIISVKITGQNSVKN